MAFYSDNIKGAFFMTLSMIGYVFNDALMKLLSADMALGQAIFSRGLIVTLMIAVLAWRAGVLSYKPTSRREWRLITIRVAGEVGGTILFLTALFNMPIANAAAILQALPIAVALAAVLFLKETVGWRRYAAIFIGFIGVLIIVRPGADGFNIFSLSALGSVAFITMRDIATRQLPRETPSLYISFLSALAATGMAALMLPFAEIKLPNVAEIGYVFGASFFVLLAILFGVLTVRVGDISFAAPFRYTSLLWAIFFGVVIFSEFPDVETLMGSALVVGAGVFTLCRENIQKKQQ